MSDQKSTSARHLFADVAQVIELNPTNPGHFKFVLHSPHIAHNCAPGQFIQVLPPSSELMLRRPFSIMDIDIEKGLVTILFRVIGEGTRLISRVIEGSKLDIIGPLGSGYSIKPGKSGILIGGGLGIPPLVFLAKKLLLDNNKIEVFLGSRDASTLVCVEYFQSLGVNPKITTEDGSMGTRGLVTELLERESLGNDCMIYACGPIPLLARISKWARSKGLDCQVSMESKLACGIGACLGCSIPTRNEDGNISYKRVCTEGPVFEGSMVAFDLI